jgi:hypothetical protein
MPAHPRVVHSRREAGERYVSLVPAPAAARKIDQWPIHFVAALTTNPLRRFCARRWIARAVAPVFFAPRRPAGAPARASTAGAQWRVCVGLEVLGFAKVCRAF